MSETDTSTTTISPEYGPKGIIPVGVAGWWACRAINQRGSVDILWDRQCSGGPMARSLVERVSAKLLNDIKVWWLANPTRADRIERFDTDELNVYVRAAGGYYYIAAWNKE